MRQYRLRESDDFQAGIERIGAHLDFTTGDFNTANAVLMDFRQAVDSLAQLPNRFQAPNELGQGIRLKVVRQKGVILYKVDDDTGEVLILRAFYGGEDYETIFRGDNDR